MVICEISHSQKFLQTCLRVARAVQGEESTSQSIDRLRKTVGIVQVTCKTVGIVQVTCKTVGIVQVTCKTVGIVHSGDLQDSGHCSGDL